MVSSNALAWSLHELGMANFNDERLTKRGIVIAASLLDHPHLSIPQACRDWAATKAAYRFFANGKVHSDSMLQSHHETLRERAAPYDTLLVAQDTTDINLSTKQITGVGSIGNGGKSGGLRGLYIHSGLAMSPSGIPLGLTSQKIYARKDETKTDAYKKTIKTKPITEKETYRWVEAVDSVKAVLPDKHIVMVGDRESDIYEVFAKGRGCGIDLLVRTNQNRLLQDENEESSSVKLFDVAKTGVVVTAYETDIPIDHHRTRKAILTIRRSPISLPPPKTRNKGDRTGEALPAIPLTVLNVEEEHPPEGIEAVHWMLTTSLPVDSDASAKEKVQWYIYRWRIERFHYTLKTGAFDIEKLQFEDVKRFKKAITLYSLAALRILHVVYWERDNPTEDADVLFSQHELLALRLRERSNHGTLTCHEAIIATAKLGGYLARKSDGLPGIKALWTGFHALRYLAEGILLGSQMTQSSGEKR